ncbi:MAG: response regulator [Pseudomonadota bacterium]
MSSDLPSILVVEDEPIIAMDIADAFEDAGWFVLGPAGTLKQAEQAIRKKAPQAALLDMNLRGTSTLSLAEQLRSRSIPVVFLTGDSAYALPDSLAGVHVISKPAATEDLVARFSGFKP